MSHQRQMCGGLFDLRQQDVAMDVAWSALVPLLPPMTGDGVMNGYYTVRG